MVFCSCADSEKRRLTHQSSITAKHTCGILFTKEIKYFLEGSSQHSRSSHICVALVGCFAFTLLSNSSQTILMEFVCRYVLGNYLVETQIHDQLGAYQRVLHGVVKCCGTYVVTNSGFSKRAPEHYASSSMFDNCVTH